MYNPLPMPAVASDAQQFEYLKFENISTNLTLDLTGVRLTAGVAFSFDGTPGWSLAPGQSVFVVRNVSAFSARYGAGLPIAGEYLGALDNGGETIRLEDATGEKILEFAYNNNWYPTTDGLGSALVIVNKNAPWDSWGLKASWQAGVPLMGLFPFMDSISKNSWGVGVSVRTVTGFTYRLEYKQDLTDLNWIPVSPAVPGDGTVVDLVDTNTPGLKGFYRIHAQ